MALIPQERHKQYAILVGIAAIALTYAFFEYWYSPRAEEVETLQSRLELLQDQNRRAQVIAARGGPELEERLAVYERHLARMEELIPRRGEVPTLLNTITSEANRYGVVMGSLRPEALVDEVFYVRESYQISVAGDFHDVGRFLTSIASLPRIISPVDLQIEPYRGQVQPPGATFPVLASFRIETYQAPAAEDPLLGEADTDSEADR
jgi:type IV pilus assembly protein PilO